MFLKGQSVFRDGVERLGFSWNALAQQYASEEVRSPRSLALARVPVGTGVIGTAEAVPFHKSRCTATRETP